MKYLSIEISDPFCSKLSSHLRLLKEVVWSWWTVGKKDMVGIIYHSIYWTCCRVQGCSDISIGWKLEHYILKRWSPWRLLMIGMCAVVSLRSVLNLVVSTCQHLKLQHAKFQRSWYWSSPWKYETWVTFELYKSDLGKINWYKYFFLTTWMAYYICIWGRFNLWVLFAFFTCCMTLSSHLHVLIMHTAHQVFLFQRDTVL